MKKLFSVAILTLTLMISFANANDEEKKEVKFGVYITNLFDINFAKNEYTVQFWSWFHHNDEEYHPNKSIEIMNAKSFTREASNEEIVNGIRWDTAKVKAKINQEWEVRDFPFDTQKFTIVIEDIDTDANGLVLKPDIEASKIDPKAIPDGWTLKKFELDTHVNSYKTAFGDPSSVTDTKQDFSRLAVDVYLQRDGWRLFSTTFIGFFVATSLLLIAFMILSIPSAVGTIQQQPRITIIVGALFSAIGSVYGLSAKLPYTTQFTLADSLQITTFVGVALAAVGSMFYDVFVKNGKPEFAMSLNRLMFAIFIALSFGLNGYMIINALNS